MKRVILSVLTGVFLATATMTYASYQGEGGELTRRQILYYTGLKARDVCEMVALDRGQDAFIVCQGKKQIKAVCLAGVRFYYTDISKAFEDICDK